MLRVALRDVLNERTVIGQKVRGNMNGLCVPNFAVFEAVLRRVQHREEAQLCADAEV
jgi:hypothetical protein